MWPADAMERMILEQDLRIMDVLPNKALDLLVIVLNTRDVLRVPLSAYPALAKASADALNNWKIIGDGYGLHWVLLDEHLSLKGFMRDSLMNEFTRKWGRTAVARRKRKKEGA